MNTMTTTQFSMRISDDLKKSLETISKISHRSQSQIANKAIAEYVEKNEWKLKAIQEAKKEADKGVFVSQEAIIDWLDSWGSENELQAPEADIFPNL
jgi:RHH-type rel operon transcriptional repressor/antitoxin RelB